MPTTLDYAVRKGRVQPMPNPPIVQDIRAIMDTLVTLDDGEYFEMESPRRYPWWTWCVSQANGRRIEMGLRPVESICRDGMLYAQVKEQA
jgi:hypothetical protein